MRYLILIVLAVSACKSPEEIRAAQEQYEVTECIGLGFKPGTESFANCRLQVRSIQAAEASSRAHKAAVAAQVQSNIQRSMTPQQVTVVPYR